MKDTIHQQPVAIGKHELVLNLMATVVKLEVESAGLGSTRSSEHSMEMVV